MKTNQFIWFLIVHYKCRLSFYHKKTLLAKVLMYGSVSVAEEVCHLNRWDQCSLPLNALETGTEAVGRLALAGALNVVMLNNRIRTKQNKTITQRN
uniref:Uncharacterized protein n=1 Tax=Amphimedon queenslandica TaxID=400682 RepID=A0A1X7TRA2_AMPQE